jgi:hypothetical protein
MQCACTMLSSVACPTLQYFSTLSHTLRTFDRKLSKVKYVLILFTNFVWNISYFNKNWAKYDKNIHMSSCKYPLFLSDFSETWIFSTDFGIILKYKISWKSDQWGQSCSMCSDRLTDGRTDKQTDRHDEANSRFSQFWERAYIGFKKY